MGMAERNGWRFGSWSALVTAATKNTRVIEQCIVIFVYGQTAFDVLLVQWLWYSKGAVQPRWMRFVQEILGPRR